MFAPVACRTKGLHSQRKADSSPSQARGRNDKIKKTLAYIINKNGLPEETMRDARLEENLREMNQKEEPGTNRTNDSCRA
jgi:hypothetical protein